MKLEKGSDQLNHNDQVDGAVALGGGWGSGQKAAVEEYDHGLPSQKGEDKGNAKLFVCLFSPQTHNKRNMGHWQGTSLKQITETPLYTMKSEPPKPGVKRNWYKKSKKNKS